MRPEQSEKTKRSSRKICSLHTLTQIELIFKYSVSQQNSHYYYSGIFKYFYGRFFTCGVNSIVIVGGKQVIASSE